MNSDSTDKKLPAECDECIDGLQPCLKEINWLKQKQREKIIIRTSITGLSFNAVFGLVKMLIGWFTHSLTITADGITNLTDALRSGVTVFGIRLANRNPSKRHPLGYGRMEYLTSLATSLFIVFAGYESLRQSVGRINTPSLTTLSSLSIAFLVISFTVNIFLARHEYTEGKRVHSPNLITAYVNTAIAVVSSILTLIAAVIAIHRQVDIEGWVSLLISILIILSGIRTGWNAVDSILEKPASDQLAESIRKILISYPPVLNSCNLVVNSIGPENKIGTVDIEIPVNAKVKEVYRAITLAEKQIYKEFGINLTIGILAVNYERPAVTPIYEQIRAAVLEIRGVSGIFAFYWEAASKTAHFGLTVSEGPADFPKLREKVERTLKERFPGIQFDFGFTINAVGNPNVHKGRLSRITG